MKLIFNLIKRISKSLKDYLSIILFIPTFLGGTWQILELYRISPYHVRFFSFSQLASDGLLILIYLLIAYFALYIPYSKIDSRNKEEQEEEEEEKKNTLTKLDKSKFNAFWYFLVLVSTFTLLLNVNTFSLGSYFQLIYLLLIIIITVILLLNKILYIWSKEKYIAIIFSSLVMLGLISSLLDVYDKMKNSPDVDSYYYDQDFIKFYNTKNVNRIIKEKIGDLPYTIKYFNDKYIFIVYENDKKEENYLNLKFDAFFEFKDDDLKPTIKKDSVRKNHIQIKDTSKIKLKDVKKDSVQ